MNRKYKVIVWCIFAFVAFAFLAFYNGLTIRNYRIKTQKLQEEQTIKAVLITDLHSCIYGEEQMHIIERIAKQKPDLILLAGDIADDGNPIINTEMFLKGIKELAPVYYVSGNHEYWSGEIKKIKETIRSFGVTVLEANYSHTTVKGVPILIGGIDDPQKERYTAGYSEQQSMKKAFSELENVANYKILLAHHPERIDQYLQYDFDLILSGHAHGGQVRIPFFLNGLLAPDQGWFPKYAGGLYKHGTVNHIVSRGASFSPRLPRIFNPPEIVCITIEGEH